MLQIDDPAKLKELLSRNRQSLREASCNIVILPGAFEPYIHEGRLFAEQFRHGTVLFVDEGKYYRLFYQWEADAPFDDFHKEKPVLLEEMDDGRSLRDHVVRMEPVLENAGFRLFKRNIQFIIDLKTLSEDDLSARTEAGMKNLAGLSLRPHICCDDRYLPQVYELWEAYLDPTDIPAAHRGWQDHQILCILNEQDEVAAARWWKNTGKKSEGRHAVTRPEYRRKGIASAMLGFWFENAGKNGALRGSTWVSDTNEASLSVIRRAGFEMTDRISRQYILE